MAASRLAYNRAEGETSTLNWILVFHVFGAIVWVGGLLVVSSMLALVPEEVGVAKERAIVIARRLFQVTCNIGAVVTVLFGAFAILAQPMVLNRGWLHVKILLVLVLLGVHVQLYRRIVALGNDPNSATRREFSIMHGIVSALLLAILCLVFLKPF